MTVSGLVVTLLRGAEAPSTLARLRADPRLTVGEPVANRLPLAVATADVRAAEALVRELEAVPGVARVDVISIDFAGDLSEDPHGPS